MGDLGSSNQNLPHLTVLQYIKTVPPTPLLDVMELTDLAMPAPVTTAVARITSLETATKGRTSYRTSQR